MGDNNALIVQILLGLMVIAFFVFVGFSVRTWRFVHIFFLVLCFFGAGTFVVFAAMTLKTHKAWRTANNTLEDSLDKELKAKDTIQFGDVIADVQRGGDEAPNLRGVKAEINRVILDRGRVWKNCLPGNFDGTTVTVSTVPATLPEGQTAKPHNLVQGVVVHLYKEFAVPPDNFLLPTVYLGEFQVQAVSETGVTLAPTIPPDADQLAQLRANDAPSWVMYEILPIDGYQYFESLTDADALKQLIGQGKMDPARYDAMIARYARTGKAATQDDPPESKWVKVKFNKQVKVDVDSPDMAPPEIIYFDPQGRAVAKRLQRGEPVQFEIGQFALVDSKTAEAWIADGSAVKEEEVYMRPLNDYAAMFHTFDKARITYADKIALVTRETKSITDATKECEALVTAKLMEKTKLESDQKFLKEEQTAIAKYEADLLAKSAALRKQLDETYRANQKLADELAQLQQQLADEINKVDAAAKQAALVK